MRTKLLLPLILAALLGCDGRYDLGNVKASNGGSSGTDGSSGNGSAASSPGGTSASAGNGGNASGSSGVGAGAAGVGAAGAGGSASGGSGGSAGTSGSAGASGSAGSAGNGSKSWLAVMSFASSASTETALSFYDLGDPSAAAIVVADGNVTVDPSHGDGFSPDGHWFLYRVYQNPDDEVYAVNVNGAPSAPIDLGTTAPANPCRWSPDASLFACVLGKSSAPADGRIEAFLDPGNAPPQVITRGRQALAFIDPDTMVFDAPDANDLEAVRRSHSLFGSPTLLGSGGGLIVQQSPDLKRGLIKSTDPTAAAGSFLIDFTTAATRAIDGNLAFSLAPSFATGFATKPDAATVGATDYVYYAIDGISIDEVGRDAELVAPRGTNPSSQLFDHTLVRMSGEQVLVVNIAATNASEHVVPGAIDHVNTFALAPTEQWLYIGAWEFDAQNQAIQASGKLWLSHLGGAGPENAQLLDSGFVGSNAYFSPDGRFLVVHGYATQAPAPVEFRLFDLQNVPPTEYTLDVPTNWAFTNWSADSRYLTFIGGSPVTGARPLYLVDAFAPTSAPSLLMSCGPSRPATPTCPSSTYFQP